MESGGPAIAVSLHGPFQVRATFLFGSAIGGLALLALAVGIPLGVGWMNLESVRHLRRATRAWEQGVEALEPQLDGRRHVEMYHVYVNYELTLRFRTRTGEARSSSVHFGRFLTGPRVGDRFTARYVPSDPDCATISWAYEARGQGWAAVVLFAIVAMVMALGCIWQTVRVWRRLALVRRLAVDGQIVFARIVNTAARTHWSQFGPHHTTVYEYVLPHHPGKTHSHEVFQRVNEPLLRDGGLATLAAVASDEHVVLKHSGSPLALPMEAFPPG